MQWAWSGLGGSGLRQDQTKAGPESKITHFNLTEIMANTYRSYVLGTTQGMLHELTNLSFAITREVCIFFIPNLKVKKSRQEFWQLVHTARNWQSWGLNSGRHVPESMFSKNTLPPPKKEPGIRTRSQGPETQCDPPATGLAVEGGAGRGGVGASQGRKRRSRSRLHPRPRSFASRRHE